MLRDRNVPTANNVPGSTFAFIDGSFASLRFSVTFPIVLDFGGVRGREVIIIYVN